MDTLSYKTLEKLGYEGFLLKEGPEKIIQFGEGGFMRSFADYFVDVLNEKAGFNGKVVLVQPRGKSAFRFNDILNEQDGLYTLYLQGFQDGNSVCQKRVISAASRCLNASRQWEAVLQTASNPDMRFILSNTTEAGIVYDPSCSLQDNPPASWPAKLTVYLYRRWQNRLPGFVILPCELIDDNGGQLQKIVLQHAANWHLPKEFLDWVKTDNVFCSTLVDRIATGFPSNKATQLHEENGYEDRALDTAEIFGVWVIEGPRSALQELPFEKAGLPVIVTDNVKPYKERKVRILNGAHTSMVLGAYLAGFDIVRDCMYDPAILAFLKQALFQEILPTLSLSEEECRQFARAVIERFKNPYIDHSLLAISLNSTSKWKVRVLPSLLEYVRKYQTLPKALAASLACYIAFYKGTKFTPEGRIAIRPGTQEEYRIQDDPEVLKFYSEHSGLPNGKLVHEVLSNTALWDMDLAQIDGLEDFVLNTLNTIEQKGALAAMEASLK